MLARTTPRVGSFRSFFFQGALVGMHPGKFDHAHLGRTARRTVSADAWPSRLSALGLAGVLAVQASCTQTDIITVLVDEVRIQPDSIQLPVGEQTRLNAAVVDEVGNALAGRTVSWSSDAPAIATVDETGSVTAVGAGRVTISAVSEGARAVAVVVATPAPALAVQPNSVAFTWARDATPPPDRVLFVENDGSGTVADLHASVEHAPGEPAGWLVASLNRTTAPAILTTRVIPDGLPEGRFSAVVRLTSFPGGAFDLPVVLDVHPPAPIIALERSEASFTVTEGGPNPPSQTIAVTNEGGGTLWGLGASVTYSTGQPGGWLSTSLSPSTAPSALSLGVDAGGLGVGQYTATALVVSPAASEARPVDVTLTVAPRPPAVVVSNAAVGFLGRIGEADPAAQAIAVSNGGGGLLTGLTSTVNYGAGEPAGWLQTALSSAQAPATLDLAATTNGLPPGTYSATVDVAASNVASATVEVTLVVLPPLSPPAIALSTGSLSFRATVGSAPTPVQTVQVTNAGGSSLTGLSAVPRYAAGQPSGWLSAALSDTIAPTPLALVASSGALAPGTYTADVEVASTSASNSPAVIRVTFLVDPMPVPPVIVLSPSSVSFAVIAGSADPPPQLLSVTNGGQGVLSALSVSVLHATGQPSGWLQATSPDTVAPAVITLQPLSSGLGPGSYSGFVRVSSTLAGVLADSIPVTLTVSPVPIPTAPSGLQARGKKGGKIEVTWIDNSDDESGFIVQRSLLFTGPWTDVAVPADTEKYQLGGLTKGARYYFRVKACNAGGCSAPSNIATTTAG